jgi:hypothetical protein
MISTFIPYAKIVSSPNYCYGLGSAEDLLEHNKYADLPISYGPRTIKECHFLELRRVWRGLGPYNITHYVVVLKGNDEMVRLPEKNIKDIGGGDEVVSHGKEALTALKAWRQGLKSFFSLSSTRQNPIITYLLPHPEFVKLGLLSVHHELVKGPTALYSCEGWGKEH